MATRDIYETDLDEDVRAESSASQYFEYDGQVTTNAVEKRSVRTVAWSSTSSVLITGQNGGHTIARSVIERALRSLQLATITACQRKSVAAPTRRGMKSPNRSGGNSRGCDVSRHVVDGGRKRNEISHTGWAKCDGWRVPSNSLIRSTTRRVNSSRVPRTRVCFVADPLKPSLRPASTRPAGAIASHGQWTTSARWPASRSRESRTRTKR